MSGEQFPQSGAWTGASSSPADDDNKEGGSPIYYRYVMTWDTTEEPLGNNGPHSLAATEQIEFQEWVVGEGWTNDYEAGPSAVSAITNNVYSSGTTASNGTIDYFKWDSDGDEALAHPHISFSIEDSDPHKYCAIIRFRETGAGATWSDGQWSSMRATFDSTSADIDLTQPDYQGNCLNENDHEWGTYTYDFIVLEYQGANPVWTQAAALDWNFLKRYRDNYSGGYCLRVAENAPDGEVGHKVWTFVPEEGGPELRVSYWLEDECERDAAKLDMITIDPSLNERASASGPRETGVRHEGTDEDGDGEADGIRVYGFMDSDEAGTWRVLWTGVDKCGTYSPYRRTHDNPPMLVANERAKPPAVLLLVDDTLDTAFDEHCWKWEYCDDQFEVRLHNWFKYHAILDPSYVGDFNNLNTNPIPPEKRGDSRLRAGHLIILGEWMSQWSAVQFGGGMLGGTYKYGKGTVEKPDRCGVEQNNIGNWMADHSDWDQEALYTKCLMHEIVHACGEPGHCTQGGQSYCIMHAAVTKDVHGRWWRDKTEVPDYAKMEHMFYGCTRSQATQHWQYMLKHTRHY